MKPIKDDRFYLEHILGCIDRVENYTHDGKAVFLKDTIVQDAVLRNLQILAESSTKLSDGLKATRPNMDSRALTSFRNVVVHDYLGVNPATIWQIIERDLPELKIRIRAIRGELGKGLP